MNKAYTKVAEVSLPVHDGDEKFRTLYVFDVTDDKADELFYLEQEDKPEVRERIMDDLEICDDYDVMPGALFHTFVARFDYPHTVLVIDTVSYNV